MKKFYSVILWGICIAAAVGLLVLLGSLLSDESMVAKKPVIYLYPEQEQYLSGVQRWLDGDGGTGWETCRPDGNGIQLSVLGRNI